MGTPSIAASPPGPALVSAPNKTATRTRRKARSSCNRAPPPAGAPCMKTRVAPSLGPLNALAEADAARCLVPQRQQIARAAPRPLHPRPFLQSAHACSLSCTLRRRLRTQLVRRSCAALACTVGWVQGLRFCTGGYVPRRGEISVCPGAKRMCAPACKRIMHVWSVKIIWGVKHTATDLHS